MKASITFPEIQNLITEKTNQSISFSFVDNKTVSLTYPLNLGFIKKDISANLIIKELVGSDLLVQLDAGFGSGTVLTTVVELLKGKVPEGFMEKRQDSFLMLHLDTIEQVRNLFEKVDITDLHVITDGLEMEGTMK